MYLVAYVKHVVSYWPVQPHNPVKALMFWLYEFYTAQIFCMPLRKQAYSNILKTLPPKNENF